MTVSIRPLRREDVPAIVAAEDEATVRWLSEQPSTIEGTEAYVVRLDADARRGKGKRAYGIWVEGTCVGTVDYDPDCTDDCEPGDVNIAYGVAPWIRGQGVAVAAVELICALLQERGIGTCAIIRADERNPSSTRVAQKAGFSHLRDSRTSSGSPANDTETMRVFGRGLSRRPNL